MSHQLLDFLATLHISHSHARGIAGTDKLIELLACRAGENILEIGFGTGATLVQLASLYPDTRFSGCEASGVMLAKATQRIKFCRLQDRIKLLLADGQQKYPFEDHSFDKIYIESVLAIQEGEELRKALLEIHRILKPQGTLLFNETIWLDQTESELQQTINRDCKAAFGIIQANAEYPHLQDWNQLLLEMRFEVKDIIRLAEIPVAKRSKHYFPKAFPSRLFTLFGKLKVYHPTFKKEWVAYLKKMKGLIPGNTPVMEGIIIKACKV